MPSSWRTLFRAEAAVRQAAGQLLEVRVVTVETRVSGWAQNRSTPGGAVDDALTVVELAAHGGTRVAVLAVVAAHPTLFPRTVTQLSPDYPGRAMRQLEVAGGGVALLFQGAQGDAALPTRGQDAIETAGAFVAARVMDVLRGATPAADRLGFAEAEVGLPSADSQALRPFLLRRPAASAMAPGTARVAVVTVGDVVLLALPGEPTAAAATRILADLPRDTLKGRKARVVALAGGYLGYIETAERVREGGGEARRAWFGPGLLEVLSRGLAAALGGG